MTTSISARIARVETALDPQGDSQRWPMTFVVAGPGDPLVPGCFLVGGTDEQHQRQIELNRAQASS